MSAGAGARSRQPAGLAQERMPEDDLYAMRHSLAHILASAVSRLWPGARFGVGPPTKDGFYYDIDTGEARISTGDFGRIEAEMHKIIKQKQTFKPSSLPIDRALAWAQDNSQPYKEELLNDLKRQGTTAAQDIDPTTLGLPADGASSVSEVSFYTNGDFTDLCLGPHVAHTGRVGAFKLLRVSGAYWRGQEDKPQLQRIYGVAFPTPKELEAYLAETAEQKTRDHRRLGAELGIFMSDELVGSGLPLWLPNGAIIHRELERFFVSEEEKRGYQHVITPELGQLSLYEKSGHYPYYKDSMYAPLDIDGHKFILRPMSCPHHFQIFNRRPRSYRELPVRLAEMANMYRYEQSGELSGLARVRGFRLADAHLICGLHQVETEIKSTLDLINHVARTLGLKKGEDYFYRLSRGAEQSDKYHQDAAAWQAAEAQLRRALEADGAYFYEDVDEAAFYGPKIDVQTRDYAGREDTLWTLQYDCLMPHRFDLHYIDEKGQRQPTVVLHRSLGAFCRLIGYLIEHYAGNFPLWLAPQQLRLATVGNRPETVNYARKLRDQAVELGIRAGLDDSDHSLGKKIQRAELEKIPCLLVIGEREIDKGQTTPRLRRDLDNGNARSRSFKQILQILAEDIRARALEAKL